MRKLSLILMVSLLSSISLLAQTIAKGIVKDAGTKNPISGVKITLLQQNISTQTNANGEFTLSYLKDGDEELSISIDGYLTQIKLVNLKANKVNDFSVFEMKADVQNEVKQDVTLQVTESELNEIHSIQELVNELIQIMLLLNEKVTSLGVEIKQLKQTT